MSEEDQAISVEMLHWEHMNRPRGHVGKFTAADSRYGPEECVRCDAPMPTARREHGFQICVDCKHEDELRARSY